LARATPQRPTRHRAGGAHHRAHRGNRRCHRRHPGLSGGFGFTLSLRLRTVSVREEQQFPYLIDRVAFEGNALPDELLRFGVQFADGRKATNLDRPPYDLEARAPDRPVLDQHGGGGGGSAWDMEHWVWPLPPAGPFAFVCEWPSRGIAESRAEIDARLILEAAGRAVTLWPDD
jgi:hypothetical protein